jgi:hypothetical protein
MRANQRLSTRINKHSLTLLSGEVLEVCFRNNEPLE